MSSEFLLRELFNKKLVQYISNQIKSAYPDFNSKEFENKIFQTLDDLSFGDRSNLITQTLIEFLPEDYEVSSEILLRSLGPELPQDRMAEYEDFYVMPLSTYVVERGIDYFEISMRLLYEMTKRFTSEGPIRPFLRKYPEQTMNYLKTWAKDPNSHVRRLVSEGTRPRLPLSSPLKEFQDDPTPVIKLLEITKDSPELFVRRSIANCLNDISKDNPDVVVETLRNWSKTNTPEMIWLIKHALRTLLKQGHSGALALLGYPADLDIEVSEIALSKSKVGLGSSVEFSFSIISKETKPQNLMIDYLVYFMKANGKTKPKVFKLTTRKISPGERLEFTKKQEFKNLSTRKQYSGKHSISIQVNGIEYPKTHFLIVDY